MPIRYEAEAFYVWKGGAKQTPPTVLVPKTPAENVIDAHNDYFLTAEDKKALKGQMP